MKKRWTRLAAGVTAAVMLAGCGGKSGSSDGEHGHTQQHTYDPLFHFQFLLFFCCSANLNPLFIYSSFENIFFL